jgi:hypothetical protein
VQSVPITTGVVNSNPSHGEVYSIQNYVIQFGQWLSYGILVSSIKKTDRHDIAEIVGEIRVALLFSFLCCVLFLCVYLHPVSCVASVASCYGLSIFDFPFGFI